MPDGLIRMYANLVAGVDPLAVAGVPGQIQQRSDELGRGSCLRGKRRAEASMNSPSSGNREGSFLGERPGKRRKIRMT